MNTNGKEEKNKTITYNPNNPEILREIKLEEDYGFQLVKFQNNYYGVNYINPVKNINETVMISTDKGINMGPIAFLRYAEEAYKLEELNFDKIENLELAIYVDPENREVYREVINSDQAETLIEKLEISREIIELKCENSWQVKYGDIILIIMLMISICCFVITIINCNNGGVFYA